MLFYRHEYVITHSCPASLVRRRRVLLWRSRHRRQRAWPGSVDMPYRLSHGRIPQLEKLTGYPVARIFKGTANDSPFREKPVRADIFVAWRFKNKQSSVRATSSEYAAPTELANFCDGCSTNMSRLRRWFCGCPGLQAIWLGL